MKQSLLDVIFLSDKRKKLLLLLNDNPKNIDYIKTSLNVTSTSIMPQIKILKEKQLINYEHDTELYKLSDIGEIIVENLQPLLDTINVFEENLEYWASRDLSAIPDHLLKRIGELGHCTLIQPDLNHMFELPREVIDNMYKSNNIMAISSCFHPSYPSLFLEIAKKGIDISIILTVSTFEKLKNEFRKNTEEFLKMSNAELHISNGSIKLTAAAITDRFVFLCFFDKDQRFDLQYIMSFDESALKWGEELFQYYTNQSTPVTNLLELQKEL